MIHTYFDALLAPMMTNDIEQRAIIDVTSLGYTDTPPATTYLFKQLVIYRAYQLVATENTTDSGDVYTEKLKQYRKEYEAVASQYKAQTSATSPTGSSAKSLYWGRG